MMSEQITQPPRNCKPSLMSIRDDIFDAAFVGNGLPYLQADRDFDAVLRNFCRSLWGLHAAFEDWLRAARVEVLEPRRPKVH